MNNRTTLSILGCCVLRDTFGMHPNDGGYKIDRYVQIPSPISLVTKTPLINLDVDIQDSIFEGKSSFVKRCQLLELKKQVFDYLFGGGISDYLIIDCAEFRKNLLYFAETAGWFSESYKDLLERYIEIGIVPEKYETIDPLDIKKEELHMYLKKFCDELLSWYDRNQIILFEIKAIEFHSDEKNFSSFFGIHEIVNKFNARMKYCFDFVKEYLHGCHIIEFPDNVIGDTNHRWGRATLHYVPEYYDYSLKAVDIITKNLADRSSEIMALNFLKRNYEVLLRNKYGEFLRNTLDENLRKERETVKILKYIQYFKTLLIEDGKTKIRALLEKRNVHSCAIYGRTQITYVFVPWLTEWGIKIDYVVENYSSASVWQGIPLIKRNDEKMINCENMIICDVNEEAIRDKLKEAGFEGNVFSYKDLISTEL